MQILVTGGAGYIGSVTLELLIDRGFRVVVIDNLSNGHFEAIPREVKFIKGDIGDEHLLEKAFDEQNIEAVIHLAAEALVELSMTDPQRYFVENVKKGLTLLKVMYSHSVNKIIFSSSAAVYGEPEHIPITEDHETNPINAYGESKLMFEKILDWYYRAYEFRSISLRYFNVAGATQKNGLDEDPLTHLIPIALDCALGNRKAVKIFGVNYPTRDGSCIRDFIHVKNIAEAHISALEKIDKIKLGKYNLGSNHGYSVKEVIETARRVTGEEIPTEESTRRVGDPAELIASNSKAKKELNWDPTLNLEDIIESSWQWLKRHPYGYRQK